MEKETKQVATVKEDPSAQSSKTLDQYFVKSFKVKLENEKRELTLLTAELDALLDGKHMVLTNMK